MEYIRCMKYADSYMGNVVTQKERERCRKSSVRDTREKEMEINDYVWKMVLGFR